MPALESLRGHRIFKQRADVYLGVATWAGVVLLTFSGWINPVAPMPAMTVTNVAFVALLFAAFMVCYILVDANLPIRISKQQRIYLVGIATCTVFAMSIFFYYGYVAILAIIVVSQLPELVSTRTAIIYGIMVPVVGGTIDGLFKEAPEPYITTGLFIMFDLFALLASHRFIAERKAKNESKKLVRELEATQMLLSAATKRDERLRIARDLHDVVGHHLTALGLQLEVALHVNEPQSKIHIKQAKDISGLLLNDVRNAVSEIRQSKPMDLNKALEKLLQNIPELAVSYTLSLSKPIADARQVEALFRTVQEALTNTIKHAEAQNFEVSITDNEEWITACINDDGNQHTAIVPGNGLKGMRERLEKLDGELSFHNTYQGFYLTAKLPNLSKIGSV